jgi:hypothetical protein
MLNSIAQRIISQRLHSHDIDRKIQQFALELGKLIFASSDVVRNKLFVGGVEPSLPLRPTTGNPPKALSKILLLSAARAPDGAVQLCHLAEAFF